MQLQVLFPEFDRLHKIFGDTTLTPIYGAGEIKNPNTCLVFMNPTARNVASSKDWNGLRAPWIGTKSIWKMLNELGLFNSDHLLSEINKRVSSEWDEEFSLQVYEEIKNQSLYITNIAKCTQLDARPLPNSVFREFLPSLFQELELVNPEYIVTFGNQVSSVVAGRSLSVSDFVGTASYQLEKPNGKPLHIYPTYYPVGQGRRNMPLAIQRLNSILN